MHFIKPVWLTHSGEKKDFEIYSCHVSPDGTRLVTAAGDGHVRVWSTDAIYNAANPQYSKPRQLASMSHHSGTIHTVRFSPNGRFLASGADDKIVCVYNLDPNPPSHSATFGTDEPPPVENWRIFRRLIGHDNDVQDLGWSYDSSVLVSVGLDSKIVVWSGHTFEKLKTITNHTSHVKGLSFDPANKHFATASDDRTVRIFRFNPPGPNSSAHDQINNFMLEKTISTPFVASPLTTYFRRCSWSPDGNHIAAANAVNGPVSSVAVINRGTWDGDIHLIGHEAPVEVCAFSPRLYSKQPKGHGPLDNKGQPGQHFVTVIACAGQDKALSVWITSNPRPLVITQDLAIKSISDLAWSPDGRKLFVTSLDGSILAVAFEYGELGFETGVDEIEKSLARFGAGRKGVGILEGTGGLLLEEQSKQSELRGVEGRMGALMGDTNGKLDVAVNGAGQVATLNGAPTNGTGETNRDKVQAHMSTNEPANAPPEQAREKDDANAAKLERLKSRVTYKDGKKRIAPLLVSVAGGESTLPRSQLMASSSNMQGAKMDAPQTILDLSKPFDGLPKGGLTALLLGNKRKFGTLDGSDDGHVEKRVALASRDGAAPILSNTPDGLALPQAPAPTIGPQPTPEFIRPACMNPSLIPSQLRLAVPKVRAHIVRKFGASGGTSSANEGIDVTNQSEDHNLASSDAVFEARNPTATPVTGKQLDREPSRLVVTRRGQPLWQDFLPRNVLLVTGNPHFWSAACEDGSIYAWTPAGRRTINALVLESQPVILESRGWWLLCITAVGMCYVWDLKSLSSPHPPVSLAPVLDIAVQSLLTQPTLAPAITSAQLNSEGRIVVTVSNGDGYAYSPAMYVWQRLSEVFWAVGSQYWNTTDSSAGNLQASSSQSSEVLTTSAGIIPHLERHTTNETLVRGRAHFLSRLMRQLLSREGFEGLESAVSIAHLENRVAAAMMLGAKEEFRAYLYMYAKRLGAEGLKSKVQELLGGLLGDVYEDGENGGPVGADENKMRQVKDRSWENSANVLCGWPRKELLKGVVLILGKHRDLQRITIPYANVLEVVGETASTDAMAI